MFDMSMLIKTSAPSPPKVVVYALPGVGKTTLAAQAEAVLIDCENGAGGVLKDGEGVVWEIIRTPYFESWIEIRDSIQAFVNRPIDSRLPKAIAIDTVDWLMSTASSVFWTAGKLWRA